MPSSREMGSSREASRLEASIRRRLRWHLHELGFTRKGQTAIVPPANEKAALRALHRRRRSEHLREERAFIREAYPRLAHHFASGSELRPQEISARLHLVEPGTEESDLFRLACLTWGVPVSAGYGRRLRFIVWDSAAGRLMGLIGLADPVFNLRTRDDVIGWSPEDRKERLVDVMNAYVLGAVPPYNMLLGGKLVSCLVRTREIRDAFSRRYRHTRGIISRRHKEASLAIVTTSSSLGRSAIYDRLTLGGTRYFEPVGFTSGWGHFHVPNKLFEEMRRYLQLRHHPYAGGHAFGQGSNWRLRASRATLELIGMDPDLLNHGVKREVFLCRLASNADRLLRGEVSRPLYKGLLSVSEVSQQGVDRWVVNRAATRKEYLGWRNNQIERLLDYRGAGLESLMPPRPARKNALFVQRIFSPLRTKGSPRATMPASPLPAAAMSRQLPTLPPIIRRLANPPSPVLLDQARFRRASSSRPTGEEDGR